jgi:hypothetical protein
MPLFDLKKNLVFVITSCSLHMSDHIANSY